MTVAAAPLPMTDLGRLLSGPNSEVQLERLLKTLDDEQAKVRAMMSAGLTQADYVHAGKRVVALLNAQMVLKSLHIYLAK